MVSIQIQKEMANTIIGRFMTGIRSEETSFLNALLDSPNFYNIYFIMYSIV